MEDIRGRYVPPSIAETAFSCPRCGALAKQFWYSVYADRMPSDDTPNVMTEDKLDKMRATDGINEKKTPQVIRLAEHMASGRPFLTDCAGHIDTNVYNVSISCCFNCDEVCVWIYDQLVWPRRPGGPQPNLDLPADSRADYEEASTILEASPRGAAALLRLVIQKLCKELGESGKNINGDIASLVQKGLDKRVQKALDIVRVIGNHAVHPGQIDLRDDRATAERLFGLVNLICEKMISEAKHVEEMYEDIPEELREAIEKRDKPKPGA